MTPVESNTVVPSAPALVWPLVSKPAEYAKWQTTHLSFRGEVPDVLTQGASFVEQVRVMGMPAEVTWTVKEVDPESRVTMTGRGPLGISLHSTIEVQQSDAGSAVRLSQEVSGSAVASLGDQLEHELRSAQERSLARLVDAAAANVAG